MEHLKCRFSVFPAVWRYIWYQRIREVQQEVPERQENGMHNIMGPDKWQTDSEHSVKVPHQIYSLSDNNTAILTLYGASKYLYFGLPISLAICGFVLTTFKGSILLVGSLFHLVVGLWVFLTYLLWVYGILGFHFKSETLHSSRHQSRVGCCGIYILVQKYQPKFKESRRMTSVHPINQPSSVNHSEQPAQPGSSGTNFITKAWMA